MSRRLVAQRYAKALLDLAVKEHLVAPIQGELASLQTLVNDQPDLARLVAAPLIAPGKKAEAFCEILRQAGASTLLRNFFQVVARAARLELFHDIVAAYNHQVDLRMGVLEATVTTAQVLTPTQAAHLSDTLTRRTGKTIRLRTSLDPGLLGGLKVQLGSTIYDASLEGRLRLMKAKLLEA